MKEKIQKRAMKTAWKQYREHNLSDEQIEEKAIVSAKRGFGDDWENHIDIFRIQVRKNADFVKITWSEALKTGWNTAKYEDQCENERQNPTELDKSEWNICEHCGIHTHEILMTSAEGSVCGDCYDICSY